MGQPVAGNPTQYMMEKAFARAGLDWRYLTLEVAPENLPDALRGLRAMGFRGANLAPPHQVAVLPHLDDLSEAARLTGAVNCIQRQGDQLIGENTAGKGFLHCLRQVTDPAGKRVTIVGAGAVARAIAVELGLAGAAEIVVVNRSQQRGSELVRHLEEKLSVSGRFEALEGSLPVAEDTDVLINATSIGLGDTGAEVPVRVETFRPELVVADVVFNPVQTRLLGAAASRGCKTLDGVGMLVNQAVIALRIWADVDADEQIMREALEEFLGL